MAAPRLFAREIVAYGNEELDRYLEANGRDRVHSVSDAVRSRPVDLDQVSARLLQTSPKRHSSPVPIERRARRYSVSMEASENPFSHQCSSQDPSTPTSYRPETPANPHLQDLRFEKEDYGELVKDGGRPWYPIHLLEEVSGHPDEHLFGGQLVRWRQFRKWQAKRRKEFEGRIADYTAWARKFLQNRHSYTTPIELAFEEDPKRQDQLTTWIESLAYECNFCTKRFEWHRRRQRWYNAQWERLTPHFSVHPKECTPRKQWNWPGYVYRRYRTTLIEHDEDRRSPSRR
ncbi:hypothetical protein MY3296_006280 [Beauveria thailandica]